MKHYTKRFATAILTIAIAFSSATFSGCSIANEIFESIFSTENSDSNTTSADAKPKPTAPVKTDDKPIYGYDSIESEDIRILYGLVDEYTNKRIAIPLRIDARLSGKDISEAIHAYKNDHPEKFWLKSTCSYVSEGDSTVVYLDFTMSSDQLTEAREEFDSRIDEIISNAPEDASQLELEKYIHDYLLDNCIYNTDATESDDIVGNSSDAYGAIIDGTAVCEGYARAFNLLCTRLGIDCVCVAGIGESENHMWNCVKLGDEWYQVDATWDDSPAENDADFAKYMYFNIDDKDMYSNHTPTALFSGLSDDEFVKLNRDANTFVPECNSTQYKYSAYKTALISDIENGDDAVNALADAAEEDADYMFILIDRNLDFDSVSGQIINDGYLSQWIDSANFNNFYSNNINSKTLVYTITNRNLLVVELQYD